MKSQDIYSTLIKEKYKVCESLAKRLETADCSVEIKEIQVR